MKIVIIGGVAAGMSAAAKARRMYKDADIIVLEKTQYISWGACGLPYFIADHVTDHNHLVARPIEKFIESGIDVRIYHEVLAVDTTAKLVHVRDIKSVKEFDLPFDRLIIATGASPVMPEIKGINKGNVYAIKDIDGAIAVKEAVKAGVKDVVIMGGGFIGSEMCDVLLERSVKPTLLHRGNRILNKVFDKEVTEILETELVQKGVTLIKNQTIQEVHGEECVQSIITSGGENIKCELLLVCTGVRPNTSFLDGTGIKMLGNGAIIIDEYGQSNLENIYACGDCATVFDIVQGQNVYLPLATTANKIGRVVGENMDKNNTPFAGTLGSACIKVCDFEAARTGISEDAAIKAGLEIKTVFIKDKNQTDHYPGQEDIYIKIIYDAKTYVILGGQIVGKKGAVLRTDVLACAIFAKLTTKQVGMLDFCYSPPFARTWDAINTACNACK